ncbi:hypothetical protein [Paracraurococcus ruber]|uniref:Uncharacterized protein n=1 Tax=Paracraurococcus ruber TaxID=77675 RepID=A0ABS1D1A4_9PROT|nr:hypothetical protein [Paracraurococcus ruber]MBK1660504.1 hypothetical protein [Paracraurococcus ruber]TDG27456.1 hypothetical protein E2C05_22820 [Paracraurococcus ruber]
MSDSSTGLSIAITPMHRTEEGIWESGSRENPQFLLVEIIRGEGESIAPVVECRDERSAALAARVVAGTIAALGLGEAAEEEARIDAFDEVTAQILAENPTPEVEAPAGAWTDPDDAGPVPAPPTH